MQSGELLEIIEQMYAFDTPEALLQGLHKLLLPHIYHQSLIYFPFAPGTHKFQADGTLAVHVQKKYIDLFFEKYYKAVPIYATQISIKRMPPNTAVVPNRLLPDAIVKRTSFYREFLKPQNQYHMLLSKLDAFNHPFGGIAFHRGEEDEPFDAEDEAILNPVLPHLARALYFCLNRVPVQTDLAASFPDSLDLTQRQQEIVACLMSGMSNREIAEKLFITEQTVKDHLYAVYKKAEVNSRTALIAKFFPGGSTFALTYAAMTHAISLTQPIELILPCL